ncbi:hypothetical protein J7K74_00355 [Candidatus Woesearchaeota archaeon]|nr:hypothetical protein [Candidatus Woesearchaeota archaeon]
MLPPQLKYMGIDKEAIENIHKKTPEQEVKELEKYGIDIREIKQIKDASNQVLMHIRKIELRLNNSEKNLLEVIDVLQKRIQQLEEQVKELKNSPRQEERIMNNPYIRPAPKKITHPIDRNGVAPADVSLDKFFNFSHKRF